MQLRQLLRGIHDRVLAQRLALVGRARIRLVQPHQPDVAFDLSTRTLTDGTSSVEVEAYGALAVFDWMLGADVVNDYGMPGGPVHGHVELGPSRWERPLRVEDPLVSFLWNLDRVRVE